MPDCDIYDLNTSYDDSYDTETTIFLDEKKHVICELVCNESTEIYFFKERIEFPEGFKNLVTLRDVDDYLKKVLLTLENIIPTKIVAVDGFIKDKESLFFRAVRFSFINENYNDSEKLEAQLIIENAIKLIFNEQCDKMDDIFDCLNYSLREDVKSVLLSVSDDFLRKNSGKKIQNKLSIHTKKTLIASSKSMFRKKQFKLDKNVFSVNAMITSVHKKKDKTYFIADDGSNKPYKVSFISDDFFNKLVFIFGEQVFVNFSLSSKSLGGKSKPNFSLIEINQGGC